MNNNLLIMAGAAMATLTSPAEPPAVAARSSVMSNEIAANKDAVRRLYEDCINPGRLELVEELVAPDFVGAGQNGPSGFRDNITGLRAGFPDIRFTIDDLIAEGDRVVVRWTWSGTHNGRFRAFAATGKPVTTTGIVIYQLHGGKVTRAWLENDRLGVLAQIGAVPAHLVGGAPPNPRP